MPRPLGHLADRLGRFPASLVGPIGSDCVIHVADRAHFRGQADLLAGQSMGVTAAIDFLVMVQANVQHQGTDLLARQENPAAGLGVLTHPGKLGIAQLARFIEQLDRHRHLADIVQHPRQAGFAHLGGAHSQLARERNHQRADRHRMHVGVFIGTLESRQADQGIGMAHDRIGNLRHQILGLLEIQRLAHPRIAEHRHHGLLRAIAEFARAIQLIFQ
ncbi:hypothetical protein D3C84_660130 [compost metagenome]